MKTKVLLLTLLFLPTITFAQINVNLTIPSDVESALREFLRNPVGKIYEYIDSGKTIPNIKVPNNEYKVKVTNSKGQDITNELENSIPPDIDRALKGILQEEIVKKQIIKRTSSSTKRDVKVGDTPKLPADQPPSSGAQGDLPPKVSIDPNIGKYGKVFDILKCTSFADENGNILTTLNLNNYFVVSAINPSMQKPFVFAYSKSFVQQALNDELGFIAPDVNNLTDSLIKENIVGNCFRASTAKQIKVAKYCCLNSSCSNKVDKGAIFTSSVRIPTEQAGDCRDI